MYFVIVTTLLLISFQYIHSVDRSKFRTCHDTRFCRKFRQPFDAIPTNPAPENIFKIPIDSVLIQNNEFYSKIIPSDLNTNSNNEYNLFITVQTLGSCRIKIMENIPGESDKKSRWQPTELLLTEGLVSGGLTQLSKTDHRLPKFVLNGELKQTEFIPLLISSSFTSDATSSILIVYANPMKFELYKDHVHVITINERQLFHYEMTRDPKARKLNDNESAAAAVASMSDEERHQGKEVVSYQENGLAIYADGE